jgi:hypothetical protein
MSLARDLVAENTISLKLSVAMQRDETEEP